MQHILTAEQFDREELERLFKQADYFKKRSKKIADRLELQQLHRARIMLSMFYEPSTRTRFSFEIAAARLGISVVGTENAAEFSSAAKGETIEDTVQVFNEYGVDAISLRTKEEGMAARAAKVSNAAILNGGDGKGDHPTQALLDVYTIKDHFKRLNRLTVVMGGDLAHGRTVRSLSKLLSKYPDNTIIFVSTADLRIGDDIKKFLTDHGTKFEETSELPDAIHRADVAYWTRPQLERHSGNKKLVEGNEKLVLGPSALKIMPKNSIIMHPLPRNQEIPTSTDTDPRAKYFEQAGNGLYIRMALLDEIMSKRP